MGLGLGILSGGLNMLLGKQQDKTYDALSKGVTNSGRIISEGAEKASNLIKQGAAKAEGMLEPYSVVGQNAFSRLSSYLNGTTDIKQDLANDRNYQAGVAEGLKAINNSAAASGMLRSGATTQALYNQAQNLANQYYQNKLSGLSQLANYGYNTANTLANLYNTTNSSLAGIQSGLAETLGQGAIAQGKINADKIYDRTGFISNTLPTIIGGFLQG